MGRIKIVIISASVIVLVAGVTAFAYLYTHGLSGMMAKIETKPDTIKIACVGDSVTYGHGISNWSENTYPAVLGRLLGDGYSVMNFGNSGTTVQDDGDQPYTATKQYQRSFETEPDIVVLMLGSNDSKPKNWKGADAFAKAYTKLLDKYISTGAAVYICTPPEAYYKDNSVDGMSSLYINSADALTSFDINPSVVDEIAEITKSIAAEKGLELIDIHALTESHPEYFLSDCVHPNNTGATAIAKSVKSVIVK